MIDICRQLIFYLKKRTAFKKISIETQKLLLFLLSVPIQQLQSLLQEVKQICQWKILKMIEDLVSYCRGKIFCKMLFRGILMKVVGETEGSEDKFWVLKNSSSKMVSCEGDQGRTKQKPVSNIFGHFDLVCCLILHIALNFAPFLWLSLQIKPAV